MLKCDLKDLVIISEQEAQYNGFTGQFDFYVFILSYHKDLKLANAEIEQAKIRGWAANQWCKSVSLYQSVLGISKYEENYKFQGVLMECIKNNYDRIQREYPNFNEFILSIANAPSMKSRSEIYHKNYI